MTFLVRKMKWILLSDRLPNWHRIPTLFPQEKLFFCPGYHRVFSHAAKIFGVDRRPTHLQPKPCEKTSGKDRRFLLSPLTFELFYQITSLAPRVPFFGHVIGPLLPNVVWSRLLTLASFLFVFFMDLDKLELTWPTHSSQVYFRLSQ